MSDKELGFLYIPITTPYLYKFVEVKDESKVILKVFPVDRETELGWFIILGSIGTLEKYVSKKDIKRYADPTIELAAKSFEKRMLAAIDIANGMKSLARLRITQMENLYERTKKEDRGYTEGQQKETT